MNKELALMIARVDAFAARLNAGLAAVAVLLAITVGAVASVYFATAPVAGQSTLLLGP